MVAVISFMIFILIFSYIDVQAFNLHQLADDTKDGKVLVSLLVPTCILAMVSIVPMILVLINLYRKGTSLNVKIHARRRHIWLMVF